MIAYMIQCHDQFDQVGRLLSWIYHEEDFFILSIDANSTCDLNALGSFLSLDNVLLAPRYPITWGGASIVQATLSAIRQATDLSGWQYFINLSGLDLPLVSRKELISELQYYAKNNIYNFLSDFGALYPSIDVWAGPVNEPQTVISAPNGAHILLNGYITKYLAGNENIHSNFRPVTEPNLRINFFSTESTEGKLLVCRPLYNYEADQRKNFAENYEFRFGRQWIIIHRDICNYILDNTRSTIVYNAIINTFIPDELYFQTIFKSIEKNPELKIGHIYDNKRFNLGEPVRITDNDYERLLSSQKWFARKLIPNESKNIITATYKLMSE